MLVVVQLGSAVRAIAGASALRFTLLTMSARALWKSRAKIVSAKPSIFIRPLHAMSEEKLDHTQHTCMHGLPMQTWVDTKRHPGTSTTHSNNFPTPVNTPPETNISSFLMR